MGPMTGRAAGFCAGYPVPGYMNPSWGFGFGRGRGGGRGWRRGFFATGWPAFGGVAPVGPVVPTPWPGQPAAPDPQQELQALRAQAEYFQEAMEGIRKRIEELEAQAKAQAPAKQQ
jgi:hypothetical protein